MQKNVLIVVLVAVRLKHILQRVGTVLHSSLMMHSRAASSFYSASYTSRLPEEPSSMLFGSCKEYLGCGPCPINSGRKRFNLGFPILNKVRKIWWSLCSWEKRRGPDPPIRFHGDLKREHCSKILRNTANPRTFAFTCCIGQPWERLANVKMGFSHLFTAIVAR